MYCSNPAKRPPNAQEDIWALNFVRPEPLKLLETSSLHPWQHDILGIIKNTANERDVYWYWSDLGGVGKSTFIKYLCAKHDAILCVRGKYADIINLVYKAKIIKLIIFDLPRHNGNNVSYDAIETLKNGCISNMKYETGTKIFNPPHIFIFANKPPNFTKLSADRWKVTNIDPVHHVSTADTQESWGG